METLSFLFKPLVNHSINIYPKERKLGVSGPSQSCFYLIMFTFYQVPTFHQMANFLRKASTVLLLNCLKVGYDNIFFTWILSHTVKEITPYLAPLTNYVQILLMRSKLIIDSWLILWLSKWPKQGDNITTIGRMFIKCIKELCSEKQLTKIDHSVHVYPKISPSNPWRGDSCPPFLMTCFLPIFLKLQLFSLFFDMYLMSKCCSYCNCLS